jgi:hypothetical protein
MVRSGEGRRRVRSLGENLKTLIFRGWYCVQNWLRMVCNQEWETTVADERAHNIHVHDGVTEDEFAEMRTRRDATLAMPRLIIPSIQVNMHTGRLPPPGPDGKRFLKVPLNAF